jgi:putative FmdB family regulatory protein
LRQRFKNMLSTRNRLSPIPLVRLKPRSVPGSESAIPAPTPSTEQSSAADSLFDHVPIYEYRCPNGHTFEVFQRMTDPPPTGCTTCGAGPVEKLLFPVAVHFKGSGFYSTDYGRANRKPAKEGEGGGEKATTEKATSDKPSGEKKTSTDAT